MEAESAVNNQLAVVNTSLKTENWQCGSGIPAKNPQKNQLHELAGPFPVVFMDFAVHHEATIIATNNYNSMDRYAALRIVRIFMIPAVALNPP